MLIDEAVTVDDAEHERLMARVGFRRRAADRSGVLIRAARPALAFASEMLGWATL